MDSTVDNTALSTLYLLESRLLRVEHLLYGSVASLPSSQTESVGEAMANLERRYGALLSHVRVYGELVKIYKTHPSLFQPPPPSQAPIELSPEAIQATVIASAASFPATASSLRSVSDYPIPDPAEYAALVALVPRMRGIEVTQVAQAAEMAELRARSEDVIRTWYETGVLGTSRFVADVEVRVEKIEREVRRTERLNKEDAETTL